MKMENSEIARIKKLGYLEELKKIYDDPIQHFKELAKQKSNEEVTEITIKNINTQKLNKNNIQKNLGYSILKLIYRELKIDIFLNNKQKNFNIDYKLNDVFSLLIFSRILYPASKKETYKNKIFILINLIFQKMICIVH